MTKARLLVEHRDRSAMLSEYGKATWKESLKSVDHDFMQLEGPSAW